MRRSMFALAGVAVLAALTALVFGTLAEGGGKAQAVQTVTITSAEANGLVNPLINPSASSLTNGDFTITCNPPPGPCSLGDGTNEFTNWTSVFTGDPGFLAFNACGGPLTSALLTLTLTPLGVIFSTDSVGITGAGGIPGPGVQTLYDANPPDLFPALPGDTRTITVDFLTSPLSNIANPAGAVAILAVFDAAVQGEIPMGYQDDAIISFAQLELTRECPPGPPAVGGIAGLRGDADTPAEASGSSSARDYTAPIAAAVAAAVIAVAAGGWYARRRLS